MREPPAANINHTKSEGQDQSSGAAGNAFGREMGPRVAAMIGAKMVSTRSNVALYRGKKIVIKTANTDCVVVTYSILTKVKMICAAFFYAPKKPRIYFLSTERFQKLMKPSRSSSHKDRTGKPTAGRVTETIFKRHGRKWSSTKR
jgi:hypothetical protein